MGPRAPEQDGREGGAEAPRGLKPALPDAAIKSGV